MKDGLDMVSDVRSLINIPEVVELLGVGGKVWEHHKPGNRGATKIDIVVNSLGVINTAFQRGIANVNIHVPSIITTQEDATKQPMPNLTKLKAICKVVSPLLDNRWMPTFHTDIQDTGDPVQDTDGSWYINIQLNYYSVQNNFKNI